MNKFYIYRRSIIDLSMRFIAECIDKRTAHTKCHILRDKEQDVFVDFLVFEGKQTERPVIHYHCKYDIKNNIMVHPNGKMSYKKANN